jgi:acetoin utilization protein AcuB
MLVSEWMTRAVVSVGPDDRSSKAASLMAHRRIRQVPVVEDDKLVGLVTKSDLLRACPPDLNPFSLMGAVAEELARPIRQIMTSTPITVVPDEPIEGAARLLVDKRLNALPVASGARLSGIITGSDISRALLAALGAGAPGVRISFDVSDDEDVFTFVTNLAKKHAVRVVSVTAFEQDKQRIAVVRLDQEKQAMVEEIWKTGHMVSSVARFE